MKAERTRAPIRIVEVGYADALDDIRRIRIGVFVREQGVPEALEMDDRDPACVHVLAHLGEAPVGTGRVDVAARGKIGRVAVEARARRRGIGTAIMLALHDAAARRGLASVWCHAQLSAVPFYAALGYRSVGPEFEEAGIQHVKMVRDLA
ncbi:MAG TPA: GNAT family N-acetyltransferase [Gammaproteobacteria bacterium]|nr:GNAT family N-acetyltransferase [Gammaproteobacteria bacterium]